MLRKLLGSKWLISAGTLGLVAIIVATAVVVVRESTHTVSYCAEMSDAVGMFPGNAVTRRGVPTGTVQQIESVGDHAVVHFEVDSKEKLPADVSAVTVSQSIIAIRQLALIGDYTGGPSLAPSKCIGLDKTSTPVSIAKSLESISTLSQQLTTGGGPEQFQQVLHSVQTLNTEFSGAGPILNSIIKQLGVPSRTPIVGALGDLATVIDNVSDLTTGIAGNWHLLQQLMETANPLFNTVLNPLIDHLTRIANALPETINVAAKVLAHYQHFAWPALDVVVPIARLVGAGMRNFGDLLGIVPVLIRAFDVSYDDQSLGLRINYTPPTTRIPAKNPELTCANINRIFPGQCHVTDPGAMEVDAIRLALLLTGAAR